jgi:hypothetical protein
MCQLSYLLEGMLKVRPEERIFFPEIISILHSFFYNKDDNLSMKIHLTEKINIREKPKIEKLNIE